MDVSDRFAAAATGVAVGAVVVDPFRTPDCVGAADSPGAGVESWSQMLADLPPADGAAGQIDQIRILEDIKAACAAAQARITAVFAASRRETAPGGAGSAIDAASIRDTVGAGDPARGRQAALLRAKARRLAARSAAAEIALARRESPQRGGRFVGLAEALVHEMPQTLAALQAGVINEWRATLIVRETACLSKDDRGAVDTEISGELDGLGDARLEAMVKKIAYRLDPEAATRRAERAACDRRVSLRPAPGCMGYLSQLLPIAVATACLASLQRAADGHPGDDGRTRAQRMADEAALRLAGASRRVSAEPAAPAAAASPGHPAAAEPATSNEPATSAEPAAPAAAASPRHPAAAEPATSNEPATKAVSSEYAAPVDPVTAVREAYARATASPDRTPARSPNRAPGVVPDNESRPCQQAAQHDNQRQPDGPCDRVFGPVADQSTALPPGTGIMINLVMTDDALFADGDEPAVLGGNLPIPAPLARRLIAELPNAARVWIRRLYTRPGGDDLAAMDSRQRTFTPAMRHLLLTRDHDTCRTPWCNAPARHADHLRPASAGGPTSIANGQALSEDCNYLRTAPGWRAEPDPETPGRILVTAPTGHTYPSPSPRAPGRRTPHGARPPVPECPGRPVVEMHSALMDRLELLLDHAS